MQNNCRLLQSRRRFSARHMNRIHAFVHRRTIESNNAARHSRKSPTDALAALRRLSGERIRAEILSQTQNGRFINNISSAKARRSSKTPCLLTLDGLWQF
ncbi:hypothetical protein EVAR_82891_1 [Eumeta japonica]|uniref:Uncharacterized protein n=1 Tax=Eumeta variegata TaxID=151549 RepID=A0A4C1YFR8_EUMVA|nr:hypothetical protein EVAR_82891_1 [Eumeta japonica]